MRANWQLPSGRSAVWKQALHSEIEEMRRAFQLLRSFGWAKLRLVPPFHYWIFTEIFLAINVNYVEDFKCDRTARWKKLSFDCSQYLLYHSNFFIEKQIVPIQATSAVETTPPAFLHRNDATPLLIAGMAVTSTTVLQVIGHLNCLHI